MKKISPYCFTKEEKDFLFKSKLNDGETRFEASKEILRDRAYLKELKKNKIKSKVKLNFKLTFTELRNGNNTNRKL